jgi:hypothetical protein
MNAIAAAPADLRAELARELEHWKGAAVRLSDLDMVASPQAWQSLEHYLGVALRQSLTAILARLRGSVAQFERDLVSGADPAVLQQRFVSLRDSYLRAETTVDFYADALATRSVPRTAALLRACDHLATRSMAEALTPMGRQVPAALTYIDKGLGASILKWRLRLWDGTVDSPVCTIKVTRHNLLRPSALVHEAGHQVAQSLEWTEELAAALAAALGPGTLGCHWAEWASEVAADAFAHVHTGFAAAAALHDVLDGSDAAVFHYVPGDPHPVAFVRVLMAVDFCRRAYGCGPWDRLAAAWVAKHPLDRCPRDLRPLLEESVRALPRITDVVLYRPYDAFGGRPLTRLIDPARVSPSSLDRLARDAGAAAFTSPYWAWNEGIRLLALAGYRAGLGATELRDAVRQQEQWMLRLGALSSAA